MKTMKLPMTKLIIENPNLFNLKVNLKKYILIDVAYVGFKKLL